MEKIITFVLTNKSDESFLKHFKIIQDNSPNANFCLMFSSETLIDNLSNYKNGALFRLIIHLGTTLSRETGGEEGSLVNPFKNNKIFANCKFDFATRDTNKFDNKDTLLLKDENGDIIHNSKKMDSSILSRLHTYEVTEELIKCREPQIIDAISNEESIIIFSAMDLEMIEIKKYFTGLEKYELRKETSQTFYEYYLFENSNKKKFKIYLKVTGKGNYNSSSITASAITDLTPKYLFYVGIAGKLKDVDIGDVVIAEVVENYEAGKDDDEGGKIRIFQGHAGEYLKELAKSIVTDGKNIWQTKIILKPNKKIKNKPVDRTGRIATGEKVLGSIKTELYNRIKHACSESLAVECEGGGFYLSCNKKNAQGLLIRGISDKLNDKGEWENLNSQPYASSCASSFLFELLNKL